ncbi:MAG: hypothetical protein GY829_06315 [Gammaproteobacteria bacterium]|nr:hypothetical protein [Gammaproteobacteria bacterium]
MNIRSISSKTVQETPQPIANKTKETTAQFIDRAESEMTVVAQNNECLALGELSEILSTSHSADELLEVWMNWRTISPQMKPKKHTLKRIQLRILGLKYNMNTDNFALELDRLWEQVKPLYTSLLCKVRADLTAHYSEDVVDISKPIPAHLLGNMWLVEL